MACPDGNELVVTDNTDAAEPGRGLSNTSLKNAEETTDNHTAKTGVSAVIFVREEDHKKAVATVAAIQTMNVSPPRVTTSDTVATHDG